MPRMLAQEHLGFVDALKYGLVRNDATLAAALAAIGGNKKTLLLSFDGDGVWTFNSPWTIPANVTLWVAPGVTVAGSGNYTILGQQMAFTNHWYTGTGTATINFALMAFGAMQIQRIGINVENPLNALHIIGSPLYAAQIRIEEVAANTAAQVLFYSSNTSRGSIGLSGSQDVTVGLFNSARFIVTGGNVGIGMVPTVQLELSTSGAQKSSGTTWTNPSDSRIKTIVDAFTDGLDLLLQVRPVWYVHNGKGGIPASSEEHVGIIGQELQQIAPYMIGSHRAKLQEEDTEETDILTFKGGGDMIFTLVNAVKTLHERLAVLEAA
jgi:hypothetical protein